MADDKVKVFLGKRKHGSILMTPPSPKAGHVHGPGCNHGGSDEHEGHDHGEVHPDEKNRDHAVHDDHVHGEACGHDQGPPKSRAARPPQTRPAENGGAAVQLALADLLPEEQDGDGIFKHFEKALLAHRAVSKVHIRRDAGRAEICIHHDGTALTTVALIDLARHNGVEVTRRFERMTWFVRGLESAQSAASLEIVLRRVPGVLGADVAYAAERLVVEYDTETTSAEAISKAASGLGHTLEVPEHGKACSMHAHGGGLSPRLQMPLALGAGVLLAVGYLLGALTSVDAVVPTVFYIVALLAAAVFPGRAALLALRARQPDVETLMILAGIGAGFLGAWFEGAFLLFLFTLGHALEHRAMERARRTIESLGELTEKTARVRRGDQIVEVPIQQIGLGDQLLVRAGDRVPLDGVIRDGESMIDQATITGESVPVARGPGDKVFAGTINTNAAIEIEVSSLAGDTLLARIVDLVTEAEAQKSKTQRFAQRLERWLVPAVLVVAIAVPLILVLTGMHWKAAIFRGVALIVAASPCALAISTPSAVLAAISRAARGGVLIKGGAHLETLGNVRAFAFDKTGTLTHGRPKLVNVTVAEGIAETDLLATAAALEALSSHPFAIAVLEGVKARGITPRSAADSETVHGKGIQGRVDGASVKIGNRAMFAGEALPEAIERAASVLEEQGQSTMLVWRDGQFLGVVGVADTLKPSAKDTITRLAAMGVGTTIMLSGDNNRVARAIADQVGIREVRAPLLPEGKVDAIRELAGTGGVAMVGDGVNDAPALAAASVGIALGGTGADAALETADVVLLGDSLERLPFAVSLARRATRVIRQNVVFSLGISVILVAASAAGWASIAQAVVLHEGSTLLVVGNALLLLRHR